MHSYLLKFSEYSWKHNIFKMLKEKLNTFRIILGSQSPRRKELLSSLDLDFEINVKSVDEIYPDGLTNIEIAEHLARLKANAFSPATNEIVITADTIVCLQNVVLGKPKDAEQANQMLQQLSGKTHEVITGVTIKSSDTEKTFADTTAVTFKPLTADEIHYYIKHYRPFDKAGAYGIQEWIGQIGITKMEGSYFTVMGLPVHRVYDELLKFC